MAGARSVNAASVGVSRAALSYVIVGGVLLLTLFFFWIQRLREARAA
jgi:hypothetical protein